MRNNMIERITNTMNELHFPCEWRIQWFQREQKVEIIFMFEVNASEQLEVADKYQTVNSSNQFVFEDAVLLYHPHLAILKDDNYLTTIAFDDDKGISGGLIDAVCKTMRLVIGEAIVELEEFLVSDDLSHFEIDWNSNNFLSTMQTYKDTGRFDATIYSYPSELPEGVVENNEVE
ncbi:MULTISPECIES: DUF3013 family protein [unclassified Jeotgalibaca]|uniref:DUF3013 family protein n=1 Tax=unclassified Jeotgalibaca TaxID=2621505 RepID=UPI003FD45289